MVDGAPVRIAANGLGIAVTEAALGAPVKIATNGLGTPIVVKASGGIPVKFVGTNGNLLAGLPWIQGTNTVMADQGARMRAQGTGGGNPRIYKHVTGLTNGAIYRIIGSTYIGTAGQNLMRADTQADLPGTSVIANFGFQTADHLYGDNFTMIGTDLYIGLIVVAPATEYSEIDKDFQLVLVP